MIPILFFSDVNGKICMMVKLSSFPASVFNLMELLDRSIRERPIDVDHWASATSSGLAA
jgi:hypothetical protein